MISCRALLRPFAQGVEGSPGCYSTEGYLADGQCCHLPTEVSAALIDGDILSSSALRKCKHSQLHK